MIRVAVYHDPTQVNHVEFRFIPVRGPEDFRCSPAEILSFDDAVQVAQALARGAVSGVVGRYQWQRETARKRADVRNPQDRRLPRHFAQAVQKRK